MLAIQWFNSFRMSLMHPVSFCWMICPCSFGCFWSHRVRPRWFFRGAEGAGCNRPAICAVRACRCILRPGWGRGWGQDLGNVHQKMGSVGYLLLGERDVKNGRVGGAGVVFGKRSCRPYRPLANAIYVALMASTNHLIIGDRLLYYRIPSWDCSPNPI